MTQETLDGGAVREVAALAARALAEPKALETSTVYSVTVPNDSHRETIDMEPMLTNPRRSSGTVTVVDAPSFAAYYADHAQAETRVYADRARGTITAVFNDDARIDGEPFAGWRDHRLVLRLQPTEPWKRWAAISGKMIGQVDFAEHIEMSVLDIEEPDGATMLDLAENFEATSKVDFQSSEPLDNGQRRFVYKETISAKAGQSGKLDIPKRLTLGLAPWEGCDRYEIGALLRYRIGGGELRLGIVLERPEVILEKAFADVVIAVGNSTETTILHGTAAEPRTGRSGY